MTYVCLKKLILVYKKIKLNFPSLGFYFYGKFGYFIF